MSNCDIIIPVYNAYDAVKECIKSVLEHTDFAKAHLIVIDDKSPDEKILPLLEKFVKENPKKITLLKNEENLGFVGTVNRGMKYSKNDVLLLNSDTEVTKKWLEKIVRCAYSDEKIATVTPLSNNATLASVPKIFTANEIPNGMSLSEMAEVVEKSSFKEYPEIPTAHGFCMFIKREVLNKVGFFDEENFGKGYGEENDFSFRCFEYGYRNVLCDDVYILHKESQSFLNNKVDNGAALAKKHPELKGGLDYWCKIRDIRRIGNSIALKIGTNETRPNLLFAIHDFSNIETNVGGTTLHVLDLIKNLRRKYNVHVLSAENGMYKIHSFFSDTDVITNMYEKPIIIEPTGLYSNTYKIMLGQIIKEYKISFIHIHHMIGHFFDIGRVAREQKIPYAVSLHDFYLETPVPSRVDARVSEELNISMNIDVWREACLELLENANYVISPSEFAKSEYLKIYDKLKIEVIEHGVEVERIEKSESREMKNVAFVGAVFPHKGSKTLLELSEKITKTDGIKLHLFGMTTEDIRKKQFYANHGTYNRGDLPKLLNENKIDLVCIFSLAPETYAYTIDETAAAGIPVITFDIGAGAERAEKNDLGWVVKYTDDTNKILQKIKRILNSPAEYEKKIKSIKKYQIRSTETMAKEYDKIYCKYVKDAELNFDELRRDMLKADLVTNSLALNGGNNYADDYFRILNSTRWRVLSKIKVPRTLKKSLKKIYHKVGR